MAAEFVPIQILNRKANELKSPFWQAVRDFKQLVLQHDSVKLWSPLIRGIEGKQPCISISTKVWCKLDELQELQKTTLSGIEKRMAELGEKHVNEWRSYPISWHWRRVEPGVAICCSGTVSYSNTNPQYCTASDSGDTLGW